MARKLRVLYLQLPVQDFGYDYWKADHPLAGGYLAAYALTQGVSHEPIFLPPALTSTASDAALAQEILARDPHVLVATLYLWNVERICRIVRLLKEQRPGLRALGGGAEAAGFSLRFRSHPFDWVHEGEGEVAFARALGLLRKDFGLGPESLHAAHLGARPPLSLGNLSSPYLMGILPLAPDRSAWVETMRGCPFGCAYCYYGKSFGQVRWFPEEWLTRHLDWAHREEATEVYFLDPSFQITPGLEERLERIASLNRPAIPLHTEARVEEMTPELAAAFARAGFASMEVGLQTVHPQVMEEIHRRADPDSFARGARLLLDQGIRLQIDVILGLPGDTPEGFLQTIDFLVQHGLRDGVTVFPLLALPGTSLRETAAQTGLRFQGSPPHQVLETPHFDLRSLRDSLEEAEKQLELGLFLLHLPDLTPQAGHSGLIGLVEVDLSVRGDVGLTPGLANRLAQCPVFLFKAGDSPVPWDRIQAWGRWQRKALVGLMPFWGIQVESPFSLCALEETLDHLHEPESYQARLWSLAPDPYLRLSCRPFILSACQGVPEFWLSAHERVPVVRRVAWVSKQGRDDPLESLPVLWDTQRLLDRTILSSMWRAFQGREEELLFTRWENARQWAALTGLPILPEEARTSCIHLP